MNDATTTAAKAKAGAGIGLLALLGILTAFDSMSIDMYLPAFTAIQNDLHFDSGTMQMSLSVFLLGLAVGQAVSGPVADAFGRKTPLLAGIAVFGLASALAAWAVNVEMFMAGRFLQGLGGAAGLVISRTIASDLYDAENATRIFTLLIQIQSISPILAPPLGGLLLGAWGWKSIFLVLVVFAAATYVATVVRIPETQPRENRTPFTMKAVAASYWSLLRTKRYLGMTVCMGFVMATLFGYISGSSYVFMPHFGLSPTAYSLIFAANSVGMILVGQLNFVLCKIMSLNKVLAIGFVAHLVPTLLFVAAVLAGADNVEVVIGLLFLSMSSLGLLFGGLTSESMFSADPKILGSASALLGVVQYAFGGAAGVALGLLHNNTLVPYALILGACSVCAAACWILAARTRNEYAGAAIPAEALVGVGH